MLGGGGPGDSAGKVWPGAGGGRSARSSSYGRHAICEAAHASAAARVRSRSSDVEGTNGSDARGRGGGGEAVEVRPPIRSARSSPRIRRAQPGPTGQGLPEHKPSWNVGGGRKPQQKPSSHQELIAPADGGVAEGLECLDLHVREDVDEIWSSSSFSVHHQNVHTISSPGARSSGSQSSSAPSSLATAWRRLLQNNSGGGGGGGGPSGSSPPPSSRQRGLQIPMSPSSRRRVSEAPTSPVSQRQSSLGDVVPSPRRRGRSLVRRTSRDSLDTSRHSSRASSNHSQSSNEEKMPWKPGKQVPAIRLQNGSRHLVSYHVLQEDKLRTKAVETSVTNMILASLNASITDGMGARAEGSRSAAVTTRQEGTPHFLVEDYRVPPSEHPGNSNHDEVGTTVPFPKGCKELRVLAFFRGKEAWVPYRNKVYAKKKRTIHVITAVDKQLDGYHVSGRENELLEEVGLPRGQESHQSRFPRAQGGTFAPRTWACDLDASPSREGIGSRGVDDEEEERPWSAREVELLHALVVAFVPRLDLGAWSQVAKHFNSRSPLACAVKWARVGSRNYTATLPDRGGSLAAPMASAVHARCRSDAVAETASPTGVECVDDRWRAPRAEGHHDLDHDRRLSLIEKLQQHFHQPMIVAAEELGISLTMMKRICRKIGMPRWPYREIDSINKAMEDLRSLLAGAKTEADRARYLHALEAADKKKQLITRGPDASVAPNVSKAPYQADRVNVCEEDTFDSPELKSRLRAALKTTRESKQVNGEGPMDLVAAVKASNDSETLTPSSSSRAAVTAKKTGAAAPGQPVANRTTSRRRFPRPSLDDAYMTSCEEFDAICKHAYGSTHQQELSTSATPSVIPSLNSFGNSDHNNPKEYASRGLGQSDRGFQQQRYGGHSHDSTLATANVRGAGGGITGRVIVDGFLQDSLLSSPTSSCTFTVAGNSPAGGDNRFSPRDSLSEGLSPAVGTGAGGQPTTAEGWQQQPRSPTTTMSVASFGVGSLDTSQLLDVDDDHDDGHVPRDSAGRALPTGRGGGTAGTRTSLEHLLLVEEVLEPLLPPSSLASLSDLSPIWGQSSLLPTFEMLLGASKPGHPLGAQSNGAGEPVFRETRPQMRQPGRQGYSTTSGRHLLELEKRDRLRAEAALEEARIRFQRREERGKLNHAPMSSSWPGK